MVPEKKSKNQLGVLDLGGTVENKKASLAGQVRAQGSTPLDYVCGSVPFSFLSSYPCPGSSVLAKKRQGTHIDGIYSAEWIYSTHEPSPFPPIIQFLLCSFSGEWDTCVLLLHDKTRDMGNADSAIV